MDKQTYAVVFPRDVVVAQSLGGDVFGVDLCVDGHVRVQGRQGASGGGRCGSFPGSGGRLWGFLCLLLVHDVVDLRLREAGFCKSLAHGVVQLGLGFLLLAVFYFLLFFAPALELLPLAVLALLGFSLLALDLLHDALLFLFGFSLLTLHPLHDSALLCFRLLSGLSRLALHPLQDASLLCFRLLSSLPLLALVVLDDPLLLRLMSVVIRGTLGFLFQSLNLNLRLDASFFTLPSLALLDITLLALETIQLVLVKLASATPTIAGARASIAAASAA